MNSDRRYDSDLNTVSEANDVHGHSSQEIGVQIDRENSNIDEPNIHDSSKKMMEMLSRQNQLLMMMLNKMMYPKILFKAYKTKLLVQMLGWKKQMRQQMFVEKLPSLIWVRIYLFKVVLK